MPYYPLRTVELPGTAREIYDHWLTSIDRELDRPDCDRNELCRTILTDLFYPDLVHKDPKSLTLSTRVALYQMDPRNVTLEPEYYQEIDGEKYGKVKPLIWLWEMFDKSPLGENVELGIRFRRILAKRIFKMCGRDFKAFHFVKLSFGYNMEVGDGVVVHRHVLLDDRGGIRLGNGASIADFTNVYSHMHDIQEPSLVKCPATIIGEGVRITYHATILAGVHLADDSMVGAMALANRNAEPHQVYVGIPAKAVRKKDMSIERTPSGPDPLAE
jgi:acetyltransferase-like isoleucine patch superfamily enzyme